MSHFDFSVLRLPKLSEKRLQTLVFIMNILVFFFRKFKIAIFAGNHILIMNQIIISQLNLYQIPHTKNDSRIPFASVEVKSFISILSLKGALVFSQSEIGCLLIGCPLLRLSDYERRFSDNAFIRVHLWIINYDDLFISNTFDILKYTYILNHSCAYLKICEAWANPTSKRSRSIL